MDLSSASYLELECSCDGYYLYTTQLHGELKENRLQRFMQIDRIQSNSTSSHMKAKLHHLCVHCVDTCFSQLSDLSNLVWFLFSMTHAYVGFDFTLLVPFVGIEGL